MKDLTLWFFGLLDRSRRAPSSTNGRPSSYRIATLIGVGRRHLGRLGQDSSGGVLVSVGVMAFVLGGFAALALDVGRWYGDKRAMQTAADAAALNAAYVMSAAGSSNADITAAAKNDADRNGYGENDGAQINVTINASDVEIVITRPSTTLLAGLLGTAEPTILARATAKAGSGPTCILALDPSAKQAMKVNNGTVIADECAIQVNSSDDTALDVMSGGIVDASEINVTGDYDSSGYTSPMPNTGEPIVLDPLSGLPVPSFSGCDHNNLGYSSGSHTLTEGVYCGGIQLSGSADITFEAGEYVITGGKFNASANVTMQGDGVFFYLDGDKALLSFSGGDINLTAPTSGTYAGILFFADRNPGKKTHHDISGGATINYEGTIYMADGELEVTGNGSMGAPTSNWTMLVAREMKFGGNGELVFNSDYGASAVPAPSGLAGGRITLTE